MKSVEIDRARRLKEEPEKGHNRWHPDIPPILELSRGEEGGTGDPGRFGLPDIARNDTG